MSRRLAALKPQLNRIRAWAHEGSTDAWIAHQLETTSEAVRAFRQEHGIERGGPAPLAPITPDSVVEAMLAEEAAALEAGPEPEPAAHAEDAPETAPARAPRRRAPRQAVSEDAAETDADANAAGSPTVEGDDPPAKPTRRRSARGGAGRTAAPAAEATVDAAPMEESSAPDDGDEPVAGDEEPARSGRKRGRRRGRGRGSRGLEARLLSGSVLLLDPSVTADAAFQEHWQGGGPLRVEISAETIVLRRIVHADADSERSDRSHTT
jgi:transcription termination factor Rho